MTNDPNPVYLGQKIPNDLESSVEDGKDSQQEPLAEEQYQRQRGANRQKRTGTSKTEIMEALSRERFPWEE